MVKMITKLNGWVRGHGNDVTFYLVTVFFRKTGKYPMEIQSRLTDTWNVKYIRSALSCLLAGLCALTAATFLYGQPQSMPALGQKIKPAAPPPVRQKTEYVGLTTARQLMHKPVEALTGDKIGSVKDVVINPQTGRIVFVVLASGGFAGIGAKLRAVPPSALSQASAKRGMLALEIGPKKWKSAPTMSKDELAKFGNADLAKKIYAFYHQPWPEESGTAQKDHPNNSAGSSVSQLKLASDLIGQSVIVRHEGEIGRVSDLSVDLKNPGMAQALVAPTDAEAKTFSVPMNAFQVDSAHNALVLNANMRSFQNIPAPNLRSEPGKMAEMFSSLVYSSISKLRPIAANHLFQN
jgi:sporulation protein YlmC with PRC-barrel domain